MSNGTPKDYKDAAANALSELGKPGAKPPNGKNLREFVEDTFYNHFMDRLRNDFALAILNRESAEALYERIKQRENL